MNKKLLRQFVKSQFPTLDFNQVCATGRIKIQINLPFILKGLDYRKLTKARRIKGIAKIKGLT
ncbi:hypothetical protein BKG91_09985 [Rodentibacter caecimuris]|uniref:Uncharacterized protein n=1 Tax=Rodentibacter caecimuris TaxID=1796644 RepID=A0A9X8W128_9PAST|nr:MULTISPECIES: hypothetical protein [Pasteurellaceae]AOF54253.1 hypothetical protein AC062_2166 [Pasteurellaceae bacterium NI1060]MCQ9122910.1 hypothetical protein [Rodentibacter heylii]OOF70018.1 hypothetical protein BKG90_11065 [Rodentibacter heylii]OOF72961.1 hypothetical protein BKG91_09985 [Rodentibacter heylii]OOF76242.1 hypothetical protein BKG99_06500 [Rodentibacter heylii]